jgi:hypothetical protein
MVLLINLAANVNDKILSFITNNVLQWTSKGRCLSLNNSKDIYMITISPEVGIGMILTVYIYIVFMLEMQDC